MDYNAQWEISGKLQSVLVACCLYVQVSRTVHLEVHDDGSMQGCDSQVQLVSPHPDAQAHTAQTRLPLQLSWGLQFVILACIRVQHGLDLRSHRACSGDENRKVSTADKQ